MKNQNKEIAKGVKSSSKKKLNKNTKMYIGGGLAVLLVILLAVIFSKPKLVADENGIKTIYFKDMVSMDAIKQLDGQKVRVVGFMAQTTPLDGSLTYLMNLPYQNCAFCVPNSDILGNTITVFPKEGKSFTFSDLPMTAVGTIKVEDYTDMNGYSYPFRLVDSELEIADDNVLPDNAIIFKTIVDNGFLIDYSDLLADLDSVTANGITDESLKIDTAKLEKLYKHLKEFEGTAEVKQIYKVVEKTEKLVNNVNETISSQNADKLISYNTEVAKVFEEINNWLLSVNI